MGGDSGVQTHLLDRKGPRLGVPDGGADIVDVHHQRFEQEHWSHQRGGDYAPPSHPPLPLLDFPHVVVQSEGAADSAALPRHGARGNMEADFQGVEELAHGDRRRLTRRRESSHSGKYEFSEDMSGLYF